jgi:hypothetical protein
MIQHPNTVYELSINFWRIRFLGDPDPEYVFSDPQYCTYSALHIPMSQVRIPKCLGLLDPDPYYFYTIKKHLDLYSFVTLQ